MPPRKRQKVKRVACLQSLPSEIIYGVHTYLKRSSVIATMLCNKATHKMVSCTLPRYFWTFGRGGHLGAFKNFMDTNLLIDRVIWGNDIDIPQDLAARITEIVFTRGVQVPENLCVMLPKCRKLIIHPVVDKVIHWPPQLTELIFIGGSSIPVTALPRTLKYLDLGGSYKSALPPLPPALNTLILGPQFKTEHFIVIPEDSPSIRVMDIGHCRAKAPDPDRSIALMEQLEKLRISPKRNELLDINILPKNIRQIQVGLNFPTEVTETAQAEKWHLSCRLDELPICKGKIPIKSLLAQGGVLTIFVDSDSNGNKTYRYFMEN